MAEAEPDPSAASTAVDSPAANAPALARPLARSKALRAALVASAAIVVVLLVFGQLLAHPAVRDACATLEPWLAPLLLITALGCAGATRLGAGTRARDLVARLPMSVGAVALPALVAAAALLVFLAPLIAAWMQRSSSFSMVGGVLPYSDASAYLFGGEHFLATGVLDEWNCRRPLNALLLAVRLALTRDDLGAAIVAQALLLGAAALVLARAIAADLGAAAGIAMFALAYAIGREHAAVCMSEPLGLTIALLATALLWIAARDGGRVAGVLGVAAMTLALLARAGAYFVVPLLVLWRAWTARAGGRRAQVWIAALMIAAVVAVFALNSALVLGYGHRVGAGNGNFSQTLYGISVGGRGWQSVAQDHPELSALGDAEISRRCYGYAFANMREHPLAFLRGLGVGAAQSLGVAGAYLAQALDLRATWASAVFALVLAVGAVASARRPTHRRFWGLIGANALGMALSAPFILPDGGSRVMICSWPLLLAVVPLALAGLAAAEPSAAAAAPIGGRSGGWRLPASILAALLAAAVAGPAAAHASWPLRLRPPEPPAADGHDAIVTRVSPGTPRLRVMPPDDRRPSFAPLISNADALRLRGRIPSFSDEGWAGSPAAVNGIHVLDVFALDRDHPRLVWILSANPIDTSAARTMRLVGSSLRTAEVEYFYLDSCAPIP